MKKIIIFQCIVFILMVGAAYADVLVVANKGVAETNLTKSDLKEIFLGKKVQWKDNSKIHFVTSKQAELHKAFLKSYINKSDKQYSNYWRKMVFTGKGKIPESFDSDKAMIEHVKNTGGAIGYINSGSAASVKTINIQ